MAANKKSKPAKTKAVAKSDTTSASGKNYLSPSGIREFTLEVQAEFKKIAWPNKKVTLGLTGFVLVLVTVISIYLGSVDLLLGKLISTVLD